MFAVCYRYTHSKDLALDLMNLAFAKVMLTLEKYDEAQPIDKWIKTIAINVVIDEFRKSKKYKESIRLYEDTALANAANGWDYDKHNGEIMEAIKIKLRDLNPLTRSVFNLHAIDGYKHKEIAQMLEIPEGTSHWHYSVAKKELRDYLQKEYSIR